MSASELRPADDNVAELDAIASGLRGYAGAVHKAMLTLSSSESEVEDRRTAAWSLARTRDALDEMARHLDCYCPPADAPSPDALGDPEGAEEAVVARDRARQGAELHGGAGWTRQSGEEET